MQKKWFKNNFKNNFKNTAILSAAIQFVIYRVAQTSKPQIFVYIFTKYWHCVEIVCKIYQYLVKIWTRVWSLIFWLILYDSIVFLCLQQEAYLE